MTCDQLPQLSDLWNEADKNWKNAVANNKNAQRNHDGGVKGVFGSGIGAVVCYAGTINPWVRAGCVIGGLILMDSSNDFAQGAGHIGAAMTADEAYQAFDEISKAMLNCAVHDVEYSEEQLKEFAESLKGTTDEVEEDTDELEENDAQGEEMDDDMEDLEEELSEP